MADRPPISYANSIDPAGGIHPSRDVQGRPLDQVLDAGASFNRQAEGVPAPKAQAPTPIPSEQVRQTRHSPDGPKPPQPFYNANAAYAHVSRANRDHDRAHAQSRNAWKSGARVVAGQPPSALSPEALKRINYRFNAARDQTERMEANRQERKHGRRR